MSNMGTAPDPTDNPDDRRTKSARAMLTMNAGLLFVLFSGFIAFGVYKYVFEMKPTSEWNYVDICLIAIGLLISLIAAVIGARVMILAWSKPKVVIPPEDRSLLEDLIRDSNEKAIDQYVRLSSLSGTTGTATKLGLTGLPLATVGLTIFFSIGAIFGIDGFLDLAKLTLGAFIGSFVQRNVTGERIASEGIKIYNQNQ